MTAEEIKGLLDPVFAKLGEMGAQAWEMAMRQVYVGVVQDAVWIVALAVLSVVAIWGVRRLHKAADDDYDLEAPFTVCAVFSVVLWVVTVGVVIGNSLDIANRLLNPAWYALQHLAELVAR